MRSSSRRKIPSDQVPLGDEGEDRIRSAYGPANYARLVAIKDRYDPTNLFRLNQNIAPTT